MLKEAVHWLDEKMKFPYQQIVDWAFTHFGKSQYWLAQQCVHIWMGFTIFSISGDILSGTLTPVNTGLAVFSLLVWLVCGYQFSKQLNKQEAKWKAGQTPKFQINGNSTDFRVFRLELAFLVFVFFPAAIMIWGSGLRLDPPFVGVIFSCMCALYFAACDPPTMQPSDHTAQQLS